MTAPAGVPAGPYLIVGAGRAGVAAATALLARDPAAAITIWDAHDGPPTTDRCTQPALRSARIVLGHWRPELLDPPPGLVIKSPGVPHDSAPVPAAVARGIPVIDELELGFRLTRGRRHIVVTGTDGKSTVCALIAGALGTPAGPVAVVGNTEFGPPLSAVPATGGPLVVETSSYQAQFCGEPSAQLAVLTNLTDEHLHRHGTMSAYGAAKRRLFAGRHGVVGLAVVNADGAFGRALARELRAAGATVATFGCAAHADYRVRMADWDARRCAMAVATPAGAVELETRLPGRHNGENVAAALAACDLLAVPRERALAALTAMPGVPGRWEAIDAGQSFDVIVDFAHTDAALRHVLLTARAVVEARGGARVHLVLCAGGHNYPAKRPRLGAIASELADRVIVTESNLRGESRDQIIADLLAGWGTPAPVTEVVLDRREAIGQAIAGAEPGDVVVVMGHGAMPRLLSDHAGGGREFDDRRVAREALRALAVRPGVAA